MSVSRAVRVAATGLDGSKAVCTPRETLQGFDVAAHFVGAGLCSGDNGYGRVALLRQFPPLPRKLPSLSWKRVDASMEVSAGSEASMEVVEASTEEVVKDFVNSMEASIASTETSTFH